jgi:EAL domain-containing protein (putative c-di-GMP-specific phosphodiesterase class I)
LGDWILQEACRQLSSWHESLAGAKGLWVAVNLSAVQLRHPQVLDQLQRAIRQSALPTHSLVVELTEGVAMDNPTAVTTLLMHMRAMGIRISIDDFGTGYSSLAYLRQFPADALKIDRSFVRSLDVDQDAVAIVASMTGIAGQLGLQVVAEGVETERQLSLLREAHCDSVQGYLFAKPLDATAAVDVIASGLPTREGPRADAPPAAVSAPHRRGGPPWKRWAATGRGFVISASAAVVMLTVGVVTYGRVRPLGIPAPAAAQKLPPPPAPAIETVGLRSPAEPAIAPPPADPVRFSAVASRGQRTAARAELSVPVMHRHGIGSCRGRLRVSPAGITFTPDDRESRDAFALKLSEFLHISERDSLTIKSSSRTYRFEAVPASTEMKGPSLDSIPAVIARLQAR